jgi:hypothetical protein
MKFCSNALNFDTITFVDSDQLLLKDGYSRFLEGFVSKLRNVGLLSSCRDRHDSTTTNGPCRSAFEEFDLWRPLLRRFPNGEEKFVHWTFWPSTVFCFRAVQDLLNLVENDHLCREILNETQIWASEEVILPTLVALLGYAIHQNPCSYEFVKYGAEYASEDIEAAFSSANSYWIHPIVRYYGDHCRTRIRETSFWHEDLKITNPLCPVLTKEYFSSIWEHSVGISGWLERCEGELLVNSCASALNCLPQPWHCVEVGSYHGRSTVLIGSLLRSEGNGSFLYAVDPHEGRVGAHDRGIEQLARSLGALIGNLDSLGLQSTVQVLQEETSQVNWQLPVGFLFIDGLHDYPSVARDFFKFDPWIVPGGLVAFHDCSESYPGVKQFISELLANQSYELVGLEDTMFVCRKLRVTSGDYNRSNLSASFVPGSFQSSLDLPLVSCIMPTTGRPAFALAAIDNFIRQDYRNRELIIVDDGAGSLAGLRLDHPQIRYFSLKGRNSVGDKRNFACERSRGEVIVHWDDDDWSADWRVTCQVSELQRTKGAICGLSRMLFYALRNKGFWEYFNPENGSKWIYGSTFAYRRRLWERFGFASISVGEDNIFLAHARPEEIVSIQSRDFFIGTIHSGNTSPKCVDQSCWRAVNENCLADGILTDFFEYRKKIEDLPLSTKE